MMIRPVLATLLLTTSIAAAEDMSADVELVPSCAGVDESRDLQTPEERAKATRALARVMEKANLLVVEDGCIDHYWLSHEIDGDDVIVRIEGPQGARRMRNPPVDRIPAAYARLVRSLLEARKQTP